MAERYPSSLRSVKSDRSFRRRSSTHGKNIQEDVEELDAVRAPYSSMVSGKSRGIPTIVEDGDGPPSESRGRMFRRVSALKDAPLPPLPKRSPSPTNDEFLNSGNLHQWDGRDDYSRPFSDVPLTPAQRYPDLERDGNPLSSYLPTPDFSRQNSIRSRFSVPKLSVAVSQERSWTRSDSSTTLGAGTNGWKSDGKTVTRGRPPLIAGSSSNWTEKWPKPRLSPRSLGGLVAAIGESEGLGIDKPDRWTTHKWVLLTSILIGFGYSSVGLGYGMLTWFRGWEHAEVVYRADADILVFITVAGSIQMFTSLVGLCGVVLNSRPILAVYCLLLWPSLISLAVVGYSGYKRSEFALNKKLNLAWSQWYGPDDRLAIQTSLGCCGYYNALHQSVPSKRCFPRTGVPGCKGKLYAFEKENLRMIWRTAFWVVPVHVLVICLSLLCSNHVTERFGKGMTPDKYRLGLDDLRVEVESVGYGMFRNGRGLVDRPEETKMDVRGTVREDRRPRFGVVRD